jgi:hypothetical protein
MLNWARWLREEARANGDSILDTSNLSVSDAVEVVRRQFD